MNDLLMVNVLEFQRDEEKFVESVACSPTVYDDGTVELSSVISGKDHRIYMRFNLAGLVKLAITTEQREPAP